MPINAAGLTSNSTHYDGTAGPSTSYAVPASSELAETEVRETFISLHVTTDAPWNMDESWDSQDVLDTSTPDYRRGKAQWQIEARKQAKQQALQQFLASPVNWQGYSDAEVREVLSKIDW